jgi:NAD-dependent deacetylase
VVSGGSVDYGHGMSSLPAELDRLLGHAATLTGRVVLLTGAGISAESGIPTFRGPEGYWQVGSRNYHPQELATHDAFVRMPDEVWAWYLYRRSVCRAAQPNAAHLAVAELEAALGDGFVLITQNVDGLHLRAGNSAHRTYQIHGNIELMRCSRECSPALLPLPAGIDQSWPKGRAVGDGERALLRCPRCQSRTRPHVLWFDECYDEERFRFQSSIAAATAARLLVVVGTAGQTNLPMQVGALVARRGAPMLVVNPEPSPFTELAAANPQGLYLEGAAGSLVPPVCRQIAARLGG